MARNPLYSCDGSLGGDFTNQSLIGRPTAEFNDSEIFGACFSQDDYSSVFPPDMTGVIFRRCNLINCYIPAGNIVLPDCNNLRLGRQNDREMWILDGDGNPVEPHSKKAFLRFGLSIDPASLPVQPRRMSPLLRRRKRRGLIKAREDMQERIDQLDGSPL